MDKATKALAQRVSALEKIVHELRNTPRKNDEHSVGPQDDPNQQSKAGPGDSLPSDGGTTGGANKTRNHTDQRPPWWIRMWIWKPWKRLLAVLVGLAGIAYAAITYWQWRDLRHNFQADERAWVRFKTEQVTEERPQPPLNELKDLLRSIEIINVGKTPAYNLTFTTSAEVVAKSQPPSFWYKGGHSEIGTTAILFQGTIFTIASAGDPTKITDDQRRSLAAGESYIAYYGDLVYFDIFGAKHHTGYCTWSAFVASDGFEARKCSEYNITDDYRYKKESVWATKGR